MATDELTTTRPTSSTEWADALHNYEREQAVYASVCADYEAACAKYREAGGDRDTPQDFITYGLTDINPRSPMMDARNQLIRDTEVRIILEDHVKPNPDSAELLTAEQRGEIAQKATRLVDDYREAHRQARLVWDSILQPAEERHCDASDKMADARNKLLTTPAPDTEAMLFKLEVLASIMVDADEHDAPAVSLLRDDAKRLLGRG